MALIITDGSKRSRKQVEVYDPQQAILEMERKEQMQRELEAQEEQERKDLIKLERMLRKDAERVSILLSSFNILFTIRNNRTETIIVQEEREKRRILEAELKEKKESLVGKEEREKKVKEREEKAAIQAERQRTAKEVKIFYNERKTDRKRALKRAEHEDPVYERVKQAWDTTQRNRMVNAILR